MHISGWRAWQPDAGVRERAPVTRNGRNGATVYVTNCQEEDVVPWQYNECTNEIPVIDNSTEVFNGPH
jgi:hypothetical protein